MKSVLRFVSMMSGMLLIIFTACKSSERSSGPAFGINTEGVIEATVATMNKDAVRIKGLILEATGETGGRNRYRFQVQEVIKYGATFSTIAPQKDQVVELVTPPGISFKKDQVIITDVTTPLAHTGSSTLRVTMIKP